MTFDPKSVEVTCVTLLKDHCVQVPWTYIKVCGYSDPFFRNLNQRSLTPRWPLTPLLLMSNVWLYPRIIMSKSHWNTSIYVDTVINFAKYHIHTTYILHTTYIHTTYRISDHIVSFWTKFRRDKNMTLCFHESNFHHTVKQVIIYFFMLELTSSAMHKKWTLNSTIRAVASLSLPCGQDKDIPSSILHFS